MADTAPAPDRVNLPQMLALLVRDAEAADARMSRTNPTRFLLQRLCAYAVGITQEVATLRKQVADKPQIVLP